jgi:hypothetical protein
MATADDLIAGLKSRGIVPSSQVLFDDTDLLTFADRIISSHLVPLLIGVRQDYFVTYQTVTFTSGKTKYEIPYRAIGRAIRDLKMLSGTASRDLFKVDLEDEHYYQNAGSVVGFYFDQDFIVVVGTPSNSTDQLKIFYECAPSRLVKLNDARVVQTVTSSSVTLSVAPTSAMTTGATVDIIRYRPGHSISHMDLAITGVSGNQLSFAASSIDTTMVSQGDYVSISNTSPVIQLPEECYSLIETLTAARFLQSNGDFEGAAQLETKSEEEIKALKQILEPRSRGEPTVIINRRSLLRGTKGMYRRGSFY